MRCFHSAEGTQPPCRVHPIPLGMPRSHRAPRAPLGVPKQVPFAFGRVLGPYRVPSTPLGVPVPTLHR